MSSTQHNSFRHVPFHLSELAIQAAFLTSLVALLLLAGARVTTFVRRTGRGYLRLRISGRLAESDYLYHWEV